MKPGLFVFGGVCVCFIAWAVCVKDTSAMMQALRSFNSINSVYRLMLMIIAFVTLPQSRTLQEVKELVVVNSMTSIYQRILKAVITAY